MHNYSAVSKMCKCVRLWHTPAVRITSPEQRDPNWQSHARIAPGVVPPGLRDWLLDEQSLTERLIRASGGDFRVQRLSQGWQRPLLSERRALGIAQGHWALVREVALLCHEHAWVYARSVIPAATLSGKLRRLRQLQNRSLGAMLFQQPGLTREAFELALLPTQSPYIHPNLRQDEPAWARRSRFVLNRHPLLVSEVFLSGFKGDQVPA